MKFYYTIPNHSENILLEVSDPKDKTFTFIYGPNGIGKSIFANSLYKKSKFYNKKNEEILSNYDIHIFNKTYIYENVYISNEKGYDSTTTQNQYWSTIFLGDKINLKYKELDKITLLKNNININFNDINWQELIMILNQEFSKNDLWSIFNLNFLDVNLNKNQKLIGKFYKLQASIEELEYDLNKDLKKIIIEYDQNNTYDLKDIRNEILKRIDQQQLINYNSLIDVYNLELLPNLIDLDNLFKKYNESLKNLNSLKEAIKTIKKYLGNDFEYNTEIKDWIIEGIKLHKDNENNVCFFCGVKGLFLLEKHNIVLNNQIEIIKEKINFEIKKINNLISEKIKPYFLTIKKESLVLKVKKSIKEINSIINSINSILQKSNPVKVSLKTKEIDKIDLSKKNDDILIKFLLKENSKYEDVIKKYFYKSKLDKDLISLNNEIDKIVNSNKKKTEKIVNNKKLFLGIDDNISINFNRAPGATIIRQRQVKFLKNKENVVKTVSDGQRFKFALLLFIEKVKAMMELNNKKNNYLIIFDDPIDSADMFTYFSFKSLLFEFSEYIKSELNKNLKIIILTHNIDYAMIQFNSNKEILSNIEFIRLYKDNFELIDYKELFVSDKLMFLQLHNLLFQEANIISNSKKYSFPKLLLISYLCLVRKFFEQFLVQIYIFNSTQVLGVDDFPSMFALYNWIKKNLKDNKVISLCKEIAKIITDVLNNKWLKNEKISKIELDKIFDLVLEIKKIDNIVIIEKENIVLNNYIFDENITLNDIIFDKEKKEWKKFLLSSNLIARKGNNSNDKYSINKFIKIFLRHYSCDFAKPFIAFDDEVLLKIIDESVNVEVDKQ